MASPIERPRRPAHSEGRRALTLLGSGLFVAAMVAVGAIWWSSVLHARRMASLPHSPPSAVGVPQPSPAP